MMESEFKKIILLDESDNEEQEKDKDNKDDNEVCDIDKKFKIDILLKEYDKRSSEINMYINLYHKQINYIYIYVSIIVLLSTNIIFNEQVNKLFGDNQNLTKSSFVIAGIVFLYYLFATILDTQYMMYINSSRIAAIERLINKKMDENLLAWDSEIIPYFHSLSGTNYRYWFEPNVLVGLWIFLLLSLFTLGFIAIWYILKLKYFYFFSIITLLITSFHIFQWIIFYQIGTAYINKNVHKISRFEMEFEEIRLSNPITLFRQIIMKYFIPIGTIAVGFIPMLICSIKLNAFWFDSPYNFPFMSLPSVYIGDLIFLPMFNYRFYNIMRDKKIEFKNKLTSSVVLVSCIILSLGINIITHKIWVSDEYTGFMDTTLGKLSSAGWWHFGFSILQTTILLLFIVIWFIIYKNKLKPEFIYARNTWIIFVAFTFISIADYIIKQIILFNGYNLFWNYFKEWSSLITIILSLSVLIIFNSLFNKIAHQSNPLNLD